MARYGLYGAMVRHSLANSLGHENSKAHLQKSIKDGIFKTESRESAFEVNSLDGRQECNHKPLITCSIGRQRTRTNSLF